MIADPVRCAYEGALLALESSMVVGLRLTAFWAGGPGALEEAQQMVSEKVLAGTQAAWRLGTGGTALDVVGDYRDIVHANRLRLAPA